MKTPTGIEIEIGQVWERTNATFNSKVTVAGHTPGSEMVQIQNVFNGRATWATLSRFNGKSGGYKLVSSPPKKPEQQPLWAVMKAMKWSSISALGLPLSFPKGGPCRLIPVFSTRAEAVEFNDGSEEGVQQLKFS